MLKIVPLVLYGPNNNVIVKEASLLTYVYI